MGTRKNRIGDSPLPHAKRGRPQKFGRPSRVVALTLPEEVVRGLGKIHPDLGWSIVALFEKSPTKSRPAEEQPDVELVAIGERQSLIAVNCEVLKSLPGINIIPLSGNRAFLALEPTHGMADLELAVIDRLERAPSDQKERNVLMKFRAQLRAWRRDNSLRFHTRSIIVVERTNRAERLDRAIAQRQPRRPQTRREGVASRDERGIPKPPQPLGVEDDAAAHRAQKSDQDNECQNDVDWSRVRRGEDVMSRSQSLEAALTPELFARDPANSRHP